MINSSSELPYGSWFAKQVGCVDTAGRLWHWVGGGLAIARASNLRGFLKDENGSDANVRSGKLVEDDTEWVWNPFKCGDVLMFHSLTIHRGRDNLTKDRIRFATSARYQPVSEPIDRAAFNVHMGVAKWEEVYSGWETDDSLKYYWKSIDMDVRKHWTQQ